MYPSVLKVRKDCRVEFSKLSFKVATVYVFNKNSDIFTKSSTS